jgi:hypothetical protein
MTNVLSESIYTEDKIRGRYTFFARKKMYKPITGLIKSNVSHSSGIYQFPFRTFCNWYRIVSIGFGKL